MSNQIIKISDGEFDSLVTIPKQPTVIFFSANWNGASKIVKSTIETASEKYRNKAAFYEIDIDENSTIPMTYGVRNVPAIITFAYGQAVGFHVGIIQRDKLNALIEKIIESGEACKNLLAFSKNLSVRFSKRFS